ncbi:MAG: hypothetical protein A3H98_02775 [Bacteroidetes bacterium RIFCSPLOWO2_02_FULL_36_8]|nr:MAG: hypothetical protein A3H98_02775 [Bacteroidetes bacterium RIFCSPLOWO2_02_FULL_36_8]OFY72205.1 MAG: hypothetical protein A3G23_01395 [Bacteroidetes bacterium RIFCSPLOWO2_12_FULL_37_12]
MTALDTDIMIDVLRQYPPALKWLETLNDEVIILSGFVVMELIQGCKNQQEQKKLQKAINGYIITWPSERECADTLRIFSEFHFSHGLGLLDAFIGQMAVTLNLPLYTFNQKHYTSIPNLKTIQPYEK